MSWGDRWCLLILVELLTIIQWVEVKGDFCWYWWNCKITPLFNSLSDGQQFHQYQQKSPLTSIPWVMVNNSTNINKNHLSPQLIEWWSTIQPISQWVKMRGDFCWYWWNCWSSLNELKWDVILVDIGGIVDHHSMSWGERWFLLNDGQQFHQYQQKSPLT
jgi:hypothetical protein